MCKHIRALRALQLAGSLRLAHAQLSLLVLLRTNKGYQVEIKQLL